MNLAEMENKAAEQAAETPPAEDKAPEPAADKTDKKTAKTDKKKKDKRDSEMETLTADLKAMEEELSRQKDLLLRTAAEFDNYKRRTEKEKLATGEFVRAQTLKSFLTVLDSMERAEAAEAGQSPEEYAKGVRMIFKQLSEAAAAAGLAEIEAAGQPFDPALHEAVMHIEDEALGENVVAEVLQKGYKVGDTVIRPAMVKVAN